MQRATAIIGANYGDEGKGLVTDFIVNQQPEDRPTAVVRFNGGAQAGHTVVTPEGKRHVFHHFGSGTLSGADTYLAKHFVLNPILFHEEVNELHRLYDRWPGGDVAADPRCYVTTPYDMIINQEIETLRDAVRHGSVGVGFGETIERNRYPNFRMLLSDLKDADKVETKLRTIRDHWLPFRLAQLNCPRIPKQDPRLDARLLRRTAEAFKVFDDVVEKKGLEFLRAKNVIFEGAQGLGLDMDSPHFPHVTRSNTGLTNVLPMIRALRLELDVIYVTRTYLTRHGAGPLEGECKLDPPIIDPTNVEHPWQGKLRFAELDLAKLQDRISADFEKAPSRTKATIAVTWGDYLTKDELLDLRENVCLPISLISYGASRDKVEAKVAHYARAV